MAAVFPIDTSQPWVNNGVTYVYNADTDSWQAVGSTATENLQELEERVDAIEAGGVGGGLAYNLQTNSTTGGSEPSIDLLDSDYGVSNVKIEGANGINVTSTASSIVIDGSDVQAIADLDDYYTKTEVDAADEYLQDQIDNLTITKGEASTYTLNEIGIAVGVRPGDFFIDNAVVNSLKFISLSPLDDNNNNRPIGEEGDILEINGPNNVSYRYSIEQISEGIAAVDYTIGTADDDVLVPGTAYSIYIYPKNGSSASVDYVNSQLDTKLSLTGGELSGSLNMNGAAINTNALFKSTRTSGYAFQVYDEENDSNPAFIHSNGNVRGATGTFTSTLEVRDTATFKKAINCDANVNSTGGWVKGNWGIDAPGKGVRWYSADRNDHLADITFQTAKLETLMYDDYLWTLKVQNSGNTDSKTLIYGDYSSGLILNEVGELNVKGPIRTEGNLLFTDGGQIDATSGNPVLSGRASLDIKTAADYPVVISSGSGYKKVLAIYGYDGSADDNRGEVAYINANGNAYFNEVYSNDEELATQTYVDGMGQIYYGDIVPAGSDVNDGDLWVDSGNMRLLMRASGAWVNPDREADTDDFKKYIAPNGRKFGFSSGTGAVTRKLNYYDSGGLKLRLSNTDAWGVKWNDGGITEDVTMSSGPYFTIWEWVNDSNHKIIRQGRISRIDYHANDILCHISSHRTNGGFSTSKNYWVTIGGII